MKKTFLFLVVASVSFSAMAQKTKKQNKVQNESAVPPAQAQMEGPEEHAAMEEQRMMGPMHHLLMQWVGHWRQELKIWPNPKVKEPAISRLDFEGRVICEGKFLEGSVRGEMMKKNYEAHTVIGYDNIKRKFIKTWLDNLGTGILILEGTMDEQTKTIDFLGTTLDPLTRQPLKVHQVMKLISPDKYILEVYREGKDGMEFKSMEITATRG